MQELEKVQLTLPADKKYLSLVGNVVQGICQHVPGLSPSTGYNIQLAVDEALVNVITHAYENDPAGNIELTFEIWSDRLVIQIRDWGHSFDASVAPQPDFSHPDRPGYGLYLIRHYMDEVVYEPETGDGNQVRMTKIAS